jgi:hypothetical protein
VCFSTAYEPSTDFEAATDSPEATMCSRSISDRLMLCVLSINKAEGLTVGGAPSALRHPPGHRLSFASRNFLSLGWPLQTPCREVQPKIETVLLS